MQLLTKDCDSHFCLSNTTRHEAMWVDEVSDPAAMAAAKALLRAASKTGLLYKRFFFIKPIATAMIQKHFFYENFTKKR